VADPDTGVLSAIPLLSGVPVSTIRAVRARGVYLDVAVGQQVIRGWMPTGACTSSCRAAMTSPSTTGSSAPAARATTSVSSLPRDGGGGYGYARLATVWSAESGRLLKLSNGDFQWLVDTEPAVKARIAETVAERLEQR
jgi:hypothetical protein